MLGAVVHALWNILAKQGSGGPLFVWAYSAVVAVLYLPLAAWAVAVTGGRLGLLGIAAVVASGIIHIGYSLALQAGYARADLSVVYPVARGSGPLLSVTGAILLLGEPFARATALGTALVVCGVLTIGLARRRAPAAALWPGLRWGAFTGLFIAGYTLNDGAAVRLLQVSPIVIDYFGNLVRCAALTPYALRHRATLAAEWRRSRRIILGVAALMPIPYILALYAMTLAPLSVIAPARELSMMAGVVFGRWLLKEPDLGPRLAGAALIAAGVAALSLG
jgi:drug/metabolite transporter (DMT)-like permease